MGSLEPEGLFTNLGSAAGDVATPYAKVTKFKTKKKKNTALDVVVTCKLKMCARQSTPRHG